MRENVPANGSERMVDVSSKPSESPSPRMLPRARSLSPFKSPQSSFMLSKRRSLSCDSKDCLYSSMNNSAEELPQNLHPYSSHESIQSLHSPNGSPERDGTRSRQHLRLRLEPEHGHSRLSINSSSPLSNRSRPVASRRGMGSRDSKGRLSRRSVSFVIYKKKCVCKRCVHKKCSEEGVFTKRVFTNGVMMKRVFTKSVLKRGVHKTVCSQRVSFTGCSKKGVGTLFIKLNSYETK